MDLKWLKEWGDDALRVIFPKVCEVCGRSLTRGEELLCMHCYLDMPRTRLHQPHGQRVRSTSRRQGLHLQVFQQLLHRDSRSLVRCFNPHDSVIRASGGTRGSSESRRTGHLRLSVRACASSDSICIRRWREEGACTGTRRADMQCPGRWMGP